jgi:membrane protease YdiL (CAAX protease family)
MAFFIATSIFCSLGFALKMYFGKQEWQLNPQLSLALVSNGIWWNIKSVLFEELIFRGVMLYWLQKKLGPRNAILLSAVGFGVYHWFSLGVFGNPMAMVMIFFITGTMGLLLAYGYTKSLSMYTPIGIHLGWNLTQIFIFSQGPIGNGILVPTSVEEFRTNSYLIFFVVTFIPILLALAVNYLIIRKHNSIVNRL